MKKIIRRKLKKKKKEKILLFSFLEFLRAPVYGELTRRGLLALSCTLQVTDMFSEEGNCIVLCLLCSAHWLGPVEVNEFPEVPMIPGQTHAGL